MAGLQERGFALRTTKSVRNRVLRMRVNRTAVAKLAAKNRCRICNQIQRGHICTGQPPELALLASVSACKTVGS